MAGPLAALGMQAASQAVGTGMGILGNAITAKSRLRQANKLYKLETHYAKEMTDYQKMKDLQMWKETGPVGMAEQLELAGLNRGLIYGMGGAGGQTVGGSAGVGSPQGAEIGGNIMKGMEIGLQMQLLKAQKENIEADTKQKQVTTEKTAGVDTTNVQADTENKILQSVILKYAGKEAADVYQYKSKESNRLEEEARWFSENTAARAIAQNITDLWQNGKLQDKSLAEIEAIILSNSKSREETKNIQKQFDILEETLKGAKLDNIIKDLEVKLQTQTGLDRNSPAWMKILGRLIVGLLNK